MDLSQEITIKGLDSHEAPCSSIAAACIPSTERPTTRQQWDVIPATSLNKSPRLFSIK